jgi:hypothetical protein
VRDLTRFLISLATPFILIFGGAGMIGLGFEFEVKFLLWAGVLVFLAGIAWCLWVAFITEDSIW